MPVADRTNQRQAKPAASRGLTVDQLKAEHPDLARALVEEGAAAERARIKGIQDLGIEGLEDFAIAASWDPGQTPETVAMEAMRRLRSGQVARPGSRLDGDFGPPLGADPQATPSGARDEQRELATTPDAVESAADEVYAKLHTQRAGDDDNARPRS